MVSYKQVSNIVKPFERASHIDNVLARNAGTRWRIDTHKNSTGNCGYCAKRPSIEALKCLLCNVFEKYGHQRASHNTDGHLLERLKSVSTLAKFGMSMQNTNNEHDENFKLDNKRKKFVTFNMMQLSDSKVVKLFESS